MGNARGKPETRPGSKIMIESRIKEYIRKNYPQLKNIRYIESQSMNNINSKNFLFYSNKNAYVLRNFIDKSSPEKIEKICKILAYCRKSGARVPEPIKNRKNEYVDKLHNLYVTKYYFGEPYKGTREEIMDAGKSVAILHKTLSQNKLPYNYKAKNSIYQVLDIKELKYIYNIITSKKHKTLVDIIVKKHYHKLVELCEFLKQMPRNGVCYHKQLIHYDLHPGNIIFSKKKVIAIIDFNTMRKDLSIYDIAYTSFRLGTSSRNPHLLPLMIKYFVDSYLKENEIEIEYLIDFDYFLLRILYTYVSSILRLRYFHRNDEWSHNIEKFLQFLSLAYKHRKEIKKALISVNI
jgi:Ser/Thr protein kinase RdoA (MazF antagonist)